MDEAVKASPSDPEPYLLLGSIALQERQPAEATKDLEKARQLLATYTNATRKGALEQQTLSGLALLAELRKDWKETESLLRELLKIAPADLLARQRLARSLFWQYKRSDAYDLLKQAKQIDRDNARKYKTRESLLTPEIIMAQWFQNSRDRTIPAMP